MVYGLKESGYCEATDNEIAILIYLPPHITMVTTPDERIWRVKRCYDGFGLIGIPITTP